MSDYNRGVMAVAAILTTIAEVGPTMPVPRGVVYAGMMSVMGLTFDEYQTAELALKGSRLLTVTGDQLLLTDKGRELAAKLEASIAN